MEILCKYQHFQTCLQYPGGRRIRFNLFIQSFSQLENIYGKEISQNIMDNCSTWLYLKTASLETANIISKKLGNYTTSSYGTSSSYNKLKSDTSNSDSMNLITRQLLTEDEIMRIERPYILLLDTGKYPAILKLPDINKYYFNKCYGMGDKEHNRKLREKRENERSVKEIKEIMLCDLWKKL